ncbi:MAG: ParB/RepB/Spo0J family partition protein [Aliarcobacter sp.]|nr:ParB/RepB/Spo0J family partition protein [Aliarcobacter sp.]
MNFSDIGDVTKGKIKTTGVSPFLELEIEKVFPNPEQPRKQFDDIEELAANIKEHGLLQPITVVKKENKYMIVSGERRYKAHLHNKAKTIIALIMTSSDEQVEELTLIENIQRSDLTDFEVAKYILKLWESGRYEKKSDLANRIGKSDTFVSKAFSCLKLGSEILEDIEQNKKDISLSVMDEISRVKNPTAQKEIYEQYSNGEITRNEIRNLKEPKKTKRYDDGVFEVLEDKNQNKQKFICYGNGCHNEIGEYISITIGDLEASLIIDYPNKLIKKIYN